MAPRPVKRNNYMSKFCRIGFLALVCSIATGASAFAAPSEILSLTPNSTCYHVGESVVVDVNLDAPGLATIVGGQFFISYDPNFLTFSSADPEAPWSREIFESVSSGSISYAVGIPDNGAGATNGTMARLSFTAAAEICDTANLVTFRTNNPPTRIADVNDVQYSVPAGTLTLNDLGAISIDSTPPTIDTSASDMTVECDGGGNAAALNAWLASHGGASATDTCSAVTWSDNITTLSDGCGATGSATVTFTATDECGNSVSSIATFTIEDTTDPTITAPADISVNADAGFCSATLNPGTPTAHDDCSGVTVTTSRSDGHVLSDPFPAGATTTITWTATDGCGHSASDTQDIIVSAFNDVVVDIELLSVNEPTLTRCITFELYNCGSSTPTLAYKDVAFSGGLATGVHLLVPCGDYDCITARDTQHSLRRTDDGFGVDGTNYTADFTSTGADGNDALIGGNFNDDDFIDILDFGIFVNRFGHDYGTGDTSCPVSGYHADASGDGMVDTFDFSFVQYNFLKPREANCCNFANRDGQPVTSITVVELLLEGMGELAIADLNRDGVLDANDVAAWLNGVRPGMAVEELPAAAVEVSPVNDLPAQVAPEAP